MISTDRPTGRLQGLQHLSIYSLVQITNCLLLVDRAQMGRVSRIAGADAGEGPGEQKQR
jgi:hypothetical protein